MFDCPKCGKKAERLIAAQGLGCDACTEVKARGNDAILHRLKYTRFSRMTEADCMRIKTTKLRADGRRKPDPRWR